MKALRIVPKYRCDYCKHTGTKYSMTIHEATCYFNPNRVCKICHNTGFVREYGDTMGGYVDVPCWACEKRDKVLAERARYEAAVERAMEACR